MKKILAFFLACILVFACSGSAFAVVAAPHDWYNATDEILNGYGKMCLTPGADETQMNFAWVTKGAEAFRFARDKALADAVDAKVTSIVATELVCTANRVTLTSLLPGIYYYSYTIDGVWQPVYSFEVADTAAGFTAMFCADPQIGRSGDDRVEAIRNDSYGWHRTLTASRETAAYSFILSAGDQVNEAANEWEYNALLYPETLRSLPLATAVGNHDFYSPAYSRYYNNPNVDRSDLLSLGGAGYYYSYGDTLFVVLNSNNSNMLDHKLLLSDAVAAYPDAVWRVVMQHHSIYAPGEASADFPYSSFAKVFDAYDIDLVLSGHNHRYSRTIPLTAGVEAADGVTYLASGSASGSNTYNTNDEDIDAQDAFWYNTKEPVYSILTFSSVTITVNSYTTDSGVLFDSFSLTKAAASTVQGSAVAGAANKIFALFEKILAALLNLFRVQFEVFSLGS